LVEKTELVTVPLMGVANEEILLLYRQSGQSKDTNR